MDQEQVGGIVNLLDEQPRALERLGRMHHDQVRRHVSGDLARPQRLTQRTGRSRFRRSVRQRAEARIDKDLLLARSLPFPQDLFRRRYDMASLVA